MGSHASPEQIAKRLSPGQREALLWLPSIAGEWKGPAPSGIARMLASMARMADPLVMQGKRTGPVIENGKRTNRGRHVPYAATPLGVEVRRDLRALAWEDEIRPEPPTPWYRRIGGMRFFRFGSLQITVCRVGEGRR